jgi:hypothetical protein
MEERNDSMFWEFVINAAVVVAAFALYAKTLEVMTALAPVTLVGQTGLSLIYGIIVASLIEGVTLALHFIKGFEGNVRAESYKWFLFLISTVCQFLDETLVKDTANRSEMEGLFSFLALGIVPSIFFGLLWIKGGATKRTGKPAQRKPFKGVRTMFREFLDGSNGSNPATQVYAADVEEVDEPAEKEAPKMRVRK